MTSPEEQGLFDTGTFDNATFNSVQTDTYSSTVFSENLRSRIQVFRSPNTFTGQVQSEISRAKSKIRSLESYTSPVFSSVSTRIRVGKTASSFVDTVNTSASRSKSLRYERKPY